ncbi:MAG: FdrA family protein, partial [Spirochaetes bacterium]|nr:FdrA family protein [Spirochaetota bacterium]
MKRIVVHKDSYYDSVFLMSINQDVKGVEGISEAVVAMGTEMNRDLLKDMGLSNEEVASSTPNDLIIAVEGKSEDAVIEAEEVAKKLLSKKSTPGEAEEYRPTSIEAARSVLPEANLSIISLPGEYAAREVRKSLMNGMHVMLFSDNVPLEQEIELKNLAKERGLLMMGPDCGTAIINGKPLCFANVVRQGNIGLVGASGTGLQEATCSIHKSGAGVSQAIGTGGRDLKNEKVGGTMMLMGIEALKNDDATKVIGVISKPPAESVAEKVISALKDTGKPCVVHFIGLEAREPEGNVHFAANLEECAGMTVALSRGETYKKKTFTIPESDVDALV